MRPPIALKNILTLKSWQLLHRTNVFMVIEWRVTIELQETGWVGSGKF
jgi:hypothetical protein